MSSVIELYEHNQKAYDALLDMLGERDRACIIKPTGTGKFVIIAKMVQDNPDKRFRMGYIEKTYGRSEKFLAFKVCFYDTLVPTREYKSGYAADRFARKCAAQGLWCSLHGLAVADTCLGRVKRCFSHALIFAA